MKVPALLYHHVGPRPPSNRHAFLSVGVAQFNRQMEWLARQGYTGVRPGDWLAWQRGEGVAPRKPVLLTFDDAYGDFPEFALPALQRFGFGAVVFVITGKLGGTAPWDGARLMNGPQIKDCFAKGIEFGAHSRTHPDLTAVSKEQLREEVAGSAEDLAGLLGRRATSFAYPSGFYNDEVRAAVAEFFELSFTCQEGLNKAQTDPHLLCRTMVQPGDLLLDFECRVLVGWSPVASLQGLLKVRSRFRRAAGYFGWRDEKDPSGES